MKKLRISLSLLLALVMLFSVVNAQVLLQDMLNNEVKFPKTAEKIVVLQAADCEILCALGLVDKIVGRGEYCNYPEEVLKIPAVSSGMETNVEQIIALEPDLVIMTKMSQNPETKKQIEEANIPVIVTDAQNIEGIYTAINLLAKATGTEENAEKIINGMKAGFEELKQEAKDSPKTIYFEVSPLQYGLWTAGKNTFMTELATLLGAKNIFDDLESWQQVSQEQVIERNPDYIFTTSAYFGEGPKPEEEISARSGWENINAVKNNNVYAIDSDMISRPAPRLLDIAEVLNGILNKK